MNDGLDALEQDHRQIEMLLDRYFRSGEEPVLHELFDAVALHSTIEDQTLYPEARRIADGGDDLVDRAEGEHAAASALIARALGTPPEDLTPLIAELQRELNEHIGFEERELFPLLRECGIDAAALFDAIEKARAG
jgi:hemerythrin superfamily protein